MSCRVNKTFELIQNLDSFPKGEDFVCGCVYVCRWTKRYFSAEEKT